MLSIQSPSALYQDGKAFRFKLPGGTSLSLRAVEYKNGVPKLRFSTAQNVPSITEEDVAVCVRLAEEKKRPEFFYTRFLPGHPFSEFGRNYMHYSPTHLKGTSVGELFAEADWKMKSLQVGALSDAKKQNFQSWCDSSKLNGLETSDKFPSIKNQGQVLMTCESVDVNEVEDEFLFVGEPKMKITDTTNPAYSDYITDNFDKVAYYDEPTFAKMREIVKLVLAIEWLRDKGVTFSKEWVQSHCNKPNRVTQEAVKVDVSKEQIAEILKQIEEATNSALGKLDPIVNLPSNDRPSNDIDVYCPQVSSKQFSSKSSESGLEYTVTKTYAEPVFKALTGLYVPVVLNVTCRVTVDDYDFLYREMDPNDPVTKDENGDLIKPQVDSFAELFAQTMPLPACAISKNGETEGRILTGGCTTSSIPVHKRAPSSTPVPETANVGASYIRKQQKIVCKPSNNSFVPPTNDMKSKSSSTQTEANDEKQYGWVDASSCFLSTSDGQVAVKRPSLRGVIMIQRLIGGEEFGSPIRLDMELLSNKAITSGVLAKDPDDRKDKDSAYASMQSLVAN